MNPPDAIELDAIARLSDDGALVSRCLQVIGFAFQYMAFINGEWDIVRRIGA